MNFIESYQMEDTRLCDSIIEWFEIYGRKTIGTVGDHTGKAVVNKDMKDSIDACFEGPLTYDYGEHLQKCIEKYKEKYRRCNEDMASWNIFPHVNIQKYNPGCYYKKFHCEKDSADGYVGRRHLVFMTYLNDVSDGGETEFLYQNVKFQPVKGRTLIWPAEWTHTHRGLVSNSHTKYIVTGWISFVCQHNFIILSADPNNEPRFVSR